MVDDVTDESLDFDVSNIELVSNNDKIREVALDILKNGDPLKYIMDVANSFHISDRWGKYIMHCSMISSCIKGSDGVQPYLSGEKGKGKTDLADTFYHLAPEGKVIKASFSNKSMLYMTKKREKDLVDIYEKEEMKLVMENAKKEFIKEWKKIEDTISESEIETVREELKDRIKDSYSTRYKKDVHEKAILRAYRKTQGTIYYMDDSELSIELESLLKRSMSDYNRRYAHHTVINNEESLFYLPKRPGFWLTSVSMEGSDQLKDRFVNTGIDESKDTTKLVKEKQAERKSESKEKFEVTTEVQICRRIYEIIMSQEHDIKFDKDIASLHIINDDSRRTGTVYYDIVKCIVATYFMQRDSIPTESDWKLADEIFENITVTNKLKLSKTESYIVDLIPYEPDRIGFNDILRSLHQSDIPMTKGRLSQVLNGRSERGKWYDGLIQKANLNIIEERNRRKYYSKIRLDKEVTIDSDKEENENTDGDYVILDELDYINEMINNSPENFKW